ncbi:MAG: S-layer homology domain-containing protein [Candidatus Cohnella colombiensis]|uniref:S-layer homology domain-containing protein n=1 Tax=Candidatus Cohnella colombiensis TaxID=3121368 RepID=A0AA95JFS7_9BACL|nr:MAG: S-layer homology domain-containing protein [Cohnella sp.]
MKDRSLKIFSLIVIVSLFLAGFPNFSVASSVALNQATYQSSNLAASASVTSVAVGGRHSIALKNDGTVWTWGYNSNGQLGDGTMTDRSTPVHVTGVNGIIAISGGDEYTVALKNDGTVWTWGLNTSGQLGDGTTSNRSAPVQVLGLKGIIAIAGGSTHTTALKDDGTVWAWGTGYLGDGAVSVRTTPVQVSGLSRITAIACSRFHTIALKDDGTVWFWGQVIFNYNRGDMYESSLPVKVPGLNGLTAIASGYEHMIHLKNDGTVWTWGSYEYGQLGDGMISRGTNPVQVSDLSGVATIGGGGLSTIALKNDGTVWTWGFNYYGQLGDGTHLTKSTPVQVTGLSGITAIDISGSHAITLKNDGTIWTWGENEKGQLGTGNTSYTSSVPVQVQWSASPEPSLTGITLDSTSYTLVKGNSHQTIVTAHYSDNTTQTITDQADYRSSNLAAATVNTAGLVSGENAGQSNITVSYLGQSATASVNVSDPPTEGYLYGVIIDTGTNAPAPGLTLTFRKGINVTDGPVVATITSVTGDYDITLPYGDYTAVITGDNYEPSMIVATVNKLTNSKNGTITRKPESLSGYLYGVIIDTGTNAPAPGLTLTFRKGINVTDGPVVATITSATGDYDVTLPYGDYTAVITGDNYEPSMIVATVNRPTNSKNGTITPVGSSPPSPPVASTPPGPPTLLPSVWLTGNQPYISWNQAVRTEQNNGRIQIRLDASSVMSLIDHAPPDTALYTIGVDVTGSAIFEIPSSLAKAAYEKAGCSGWILVLTETGSYTLPLQVLNANEGLEDGAVTRIEVSPTEQPESSRIISAAEKAQVTLLPAPATTFSLTITHEGKAKTIKDFGDFYVERSIRLGDKENLFPPQPLMPGIFLFDQERGSFQFTPARLVNDENGTVHAIIRSTGNSTYVAGYKKVSFHDIGSHWAESAINKLASKGLISGTRQNRFEPDEPVTRAEFTALLVRGLGLQDQKVSGSFSDVKANNWYSNEVLIAEQKKLVSGHNDAFRPNDKLTREEMAVMIARALEYAAPTRIFPLADLDSFTDADRISDWARWSFRISVVNGILIGTSQRSLDPTGTCTRAQAVIVLERMLRTLALSD